MERLKLELQVLKKAIILEKEEQVKMSPVPVPAALALVREDGVEQRMTSLEEAVRDLRETLGWGV